MIKYSLDNENYIKQKKLKIVEIKDIKEYALYENYMISLINNFNDEYNWDDMFDINLVKDRVKNKHILFILFYGEYAIGYVFFKEITKEICFGYNLYVTKKIQRPNTSAEWFYNEVSGIMLKKYETIEVEVEDWHNTIQNIIENIGYKKI